MEKTGDRGAPLVPDGALQPKPLQPAPPAAVETWAEGTSPAAPPLEAISCKVASERDRGAILELLREYLPELNADARYDWLYRQNPHGAAHTFLAFDRGGQPVAMTSFFPRKLWVNGRVVSAALGGDGYTRPSHRGQGIGTRLHRLSQNEQERLGIEVMFGTPSAMNQGPLARVDTQNSASVARYVRPLTVPARLGWLPGARQLNRWLGRPRRDGNGKRWYLDPMTSGDFRVDRIWNDFVAASAGRGIATVRDSRFYEWRFRQHLGRYPQEAYVICDRDDFIGICALQPRENRCLLLDILAPPDAVSDCLQAILSCQPPEVSALELRFNPQHPMARHFLPHGFLRRGEPRIINVMPSPSGNAADYARGSDWLFTWLESDMPHID